MSNALTVPERCILLRDGIEIWVDENKALRISEDLIRGAKGAMVMIEDRLVNTVEIVGIFLPVDLEEMKRRKAGQVKCKFGNWHSRDDICQCHREEDKYLETSSNHRYRDWVIDGQKMDFKEYVDKFGI